MSSDRNDVEVVHNEEDHRFEATVDGYLAVAEYRRQGSTIVFIHTEVPPAIEGTGIGQRLVRAGLDFAREHELRVVPRCPFVAAFIRRHPEYSSLVDG